MRQKTEEAALQLKEEPVMVLFVLQVEEGEGTWLKQRSSRPFLCSRFMKWCVGVGRKPPGKSSLASR